MTTKLRAASFQDSAVTTAKIAADAVTNAKIADDAVQTENVASTVNLGRRNIIINGAMQVAQRGTSVTGVTSGGYKTCDRWSVSNTSQGTWTISQSSTAPSDFANSLKFDCTTADGTTNASDQLGVDTRIEAKDLIQLNYGTSSAKTITVSFHVRSNKTGTYTFEAYAQDPNRGFSKTYTIDSANTWEKKEIVIPGDTSASQNFDDNSQIGFVLKWWLAAGSTFTGGTYSDNVWRDNVSANRISSSNVNLADSTSNEWYITGVQVELGSQATPFEHRSFGEELQLCKRYFQVLADGSRSQNEAICAGAYYTASILFHSVVLPVEMRSQPTMVTTNGTNYYITFSNGSGDHHDAIARSGNSSKSVVEIYAETNVGGTAGHACFTRIGGTSSDAKCMLDAEL